jgi:cysteine desulfurase
MSGMTGMYRRNPNRSGPIYLDYNATTPLAPEVIEAIRPYMEEHFGNPSSSHGYGMKASEAVEVARQRVAGLLNCLPREIVFTSGGTESNNYAIKGAVLALQSRGSHIITSRVEHPAVTEVCRYLEKGGFQVTYLPVDEFGTISLDDLEKAITPQTILISIMHANNEVGTIQPIEEVSRIARKRGILLHTDAAQSVGKIPTDVESLGVDLLSVAGHKLYAPKGVGALYIREGVRLERLMHGAGQENGWRPGTENVIEVVGLGKASGIAGTDLEENMRHMATMRDRLHRGLQNGWGALKLNGHPEDRLPNTLNLSFRGLEANKLLLRVQDRVAASAGAACHSAGVDVSDVIRAMGVPLDWAKGTLRFSTGRMTTPEDIDEATKAVLTACINDA